jgi:hypothetical protein
VLKVKIKCLKSKKIKICGRRNCRVLKKVPYMHLREKHTENKLKIENL